MKILKFIFFTFLGILILSFLYLLHSKEVTKKIFEYSKQIAPIAYSKVEGNLYGGITISNLNYDNMIKVDEFKIDLSILSLLVLEVFIEDLKIKGIKFDEKLFNQTQTQNNSTNLEIPFNLFIKNFEASMYDYSYNEYKVDELLLKAKNTKWDFKDNLKGKIDITINSNIAKIKGFLELENIKNYNLNSKIDLQKEFISKFTKIDELNEINLKAKGNLQKVDFQISTKGLDLSKEIEDLSFEDLKLLGNFDISSSKLEINSFDWLIKYKNLSSKINVKSDLKKDSLKLQAFSNLGDLQITSNDLKRFDFDFNSKNINPNEFYKLDDSLNIEEINTKIKGFFDGNIQAVADISINNSFFIKSDLKKDSQGLKAKIQNSAFTSNISQESEIFHIKSNIDSLEILQKELQKILKFDALNLKGKIDSKVSINRENIDFDINSEKISYNNESLEKLSIKGFFKDKFLYFDSLNFSLNALDELSIQKEFKLKKQAFFNIENLQSDILYDNISIKSQKENEIINLKIVTNDFFLAHSSFGSLFLKSDLLISINKNKINLSGDIVLNKLTAIYNIPSISISKDRDIIIISKDKKVTQRDSFFEDISLELSISSDEINYVTNNINLKTSLFLYVKKDFSSNIKLYGTVDNIRGDFSELGKDYTIQNSTVYFRGLEDINPLLEINALHKLEEVDITIMIRGSANFPKITFSSNPIMNQKDILSYLIFGTRFGSNIPKSQQSKQSQASLFLLNELSKDYAKKLGIDMLYFQYNPSTQYIETIVGKNLSQKSKILLKDKANSGELILMRELTKLWNVQIGIEEKTQSIDLIYKKRY